MHSGKDYPLKCPKCGSDNFQDEGIADMSETVLVYEMRCTNCETVISLEWGPFKKWEVIQ